MHEELVGVSWGSHPRRPIALVVHRTQWQSRSRPVPPSVGQVMPRSALLPPPLCFPCALVPVALRVPGLAVLQGFAVVASPMTHEASAAHFVHEWHRLPGSSCPAASCAHSHNLPGCWQLVLGGQTKSFSLSADRVWARRGWPHDHPAAGLAYLLTIRCAFFFTTGFL